MVHNKRLGGEMIKVYYEQEVYSFNTWDEADKFIKDLEETIAKQERRSAIISDWEE